jgi:hypothetical protein
LTGCFLLVPRTIMHKKAWERIVELLSIAGSIIHHSQGWYWLYLAVISAAIGALGYFRGNEWVLWIACILISSLGSAFASWVYAVRYNGRKDKRIADSFFQLETYYAPFSKIAIQIILNAKDNNTDKQHLRDDLIRLRNAHREYLTQICITAAGVLSAKKGRRIPLSANIKSIYVDRGRRVQYKPLVTSELHTSARFEYDQKIAAQERYIDNCYMYKRMFDKTIEKDYVIIENVDAVIREAAKNKEKIDEPNTESSKLARSCFVYPIYDELSIHDNKEHQELEGEIKDNTTRLRSHFDGKELLLYNDREVFGLMCVDSGKRGIFDEGYDLAVVRQLTSYAFESFRVLRAVQETVGR